MSDKLEELQALLREEYSHLRQAESRRDTLRDLVANAISDFEEQQSEIDEIQETIHDIEDEILRLS